MDDKDLKQLILETATETREHADLVAAETRQHFDLVAEDLGHKIQLVAEGVTANGEQIDRLEKRVDRLENEMHREFEEVRSMIRLSYTELDRRLRSLEETVTHLQARMDRMESRSPQ